GIPVVVVIAPHTSEAVGGPGDLSLGGHIPKCAITVVAIKRIPPFITAGYAAAIHEIDIGKAVGVEVGDAYSGSCFLQDGRHAAATLLVHEFNTRLTCCVMELDGLARERISQEDGNSGQGNARRESTHLQRGLPVPETAFFNSSVVSRAFSDVRRWA